MTIACTGLGGFAVLLALEIIAQRLFNALGQGFTFPSITGLWRYKCHILGHISGVFRRTRLGIVWYQALRTEEQCGS
jgi:hypothetical protein